MSVGHTGYATIERADARNKGNDMPIRLGKPLHETSRKTTNIPDSFQNTTVLVTSQILTSRQPHNYGQIRMNTADYLSSMA